MLFLVREMGLEPIRDYHTPLKRARLPIPPLSRVLGTINIIPLPSCVVNTFFIIHEVFPVLRLFYQKLPPEDI